MPQESGFARHVGAGEEQAGGRARDRSCWGRRRRGRRGRPGRPDGGRLDVKFVVSVTSGRSTGPPSARAGRRIGRHQGVRATRRMRRGCLNERPPVFPRWAKTSVRSRLALFGRFSRMRRSSSVSPAAVNRAPFAMPWRRVSSGKGAQLFDRDGRRLDDIAKLRHGV